MDEHREEREELRDIEREHEDEARMDRIEWADHEGFSWAQFVTAETEAWSR